MIAVWEHISNSDVRILVTGAENWSYKYRCRSEFLVLPDFFQGNINFEVCNARITTEIKCFS